MDLRGPILAMYQFPTLVIFCEGQGIATAKSLIETQPSEGGLNFPYREDVRLYYRVCHSSAASIFPIAAAVMNRSSIALLPFLSALQHAGMTHHGDTSAGAKPGGPLLQGPL